MGWIADRQAEATDLLFKAIEPSLPRGEILRGCAFGTRSTGSFLSRTFVLGVSDQHLFVQEVDRSWKRVDAPLVLEPDQIEVLNLFGDDKKFAKLRKSGEQICFVANDAEHGFNVLGKNAIQQLLGGAEQRDGLLKVVEFLKAARDMRSGGD